MKSNKKFKTSLAVIGLAIGSIAMSMQAMAETKLGGDVLTRFGAERSGNADGSIPPYTGGLKEIPANYVPGSGRFPNPFSDEEPIAIVNSANMHEHEQYLTSLVKHFMKEFPDFYINVYPSHRTIKYPEWVLDNTERHVESASLTGRIQGDGVDGAYAGIPFPLPKNGNEVMWNSLLHYRPVWTEFVNTNYLVRSSGGSTLLGLFNAYLKNSYYDTSKSTLDDPYFWQYMAVGFAPASQAGYALLTTNSINYSEADNLSWVYTPGQRRVRTAPEFSYDTPAANFGGAVLYDEIQVFGGRQDRFDFKLVGKEEKYIPYNIYRIAEGEFPKKDDYLTANYSNPEYHRFEKHRVWVIEATLKEGSRHVMEKKRIYVDEDSWIIIEASGFDHAGDLYRAGLTFPFFAYDPELPVMNYLPYEVYDLKKGTYMSTNVVAESNDQLRFSFSDTIRDNAAHDPVRMGARGIR